MIRKVEDINIRGIHAVFIGKFIAFNVYLRKEEVLEFVAHERKH